MAPRPSFQFYPADWLGNANLMRCTHEQKGIWINVMCLMHDSPTEYGVIRWPLKEIGQAVNCKVSSLADLVKKGVLKGADPGEMCEAFVFTPRHGRKDGDPVVLIQPQPGPLWYSSRMVKDEYIRSVRGESTRFKEGGDDGIGDAPKPTPKPPFGDGSSSSSSSSSFNPLLRSDSGPGQGRHSFGSQIDPVLLALPCTKGKCFHITQTTLDGWKDAFPELEPLAEAKQMKFWLESNPSRQKTFGGMGKFFSSWLRSSQDKAKSAKKEGRGASPATGRATAVQDYLSANPDAIGESNVA
jgi:hypothetical protein